jgi:hypothetical protein
MTNLPLISRRTLLAASALAAPVFNAFAQAPRVLRIGNQKAC